MEIGMSEQIQAINDYVLVKLDKDITTTENGLALPDSLVQRASTGIVVNIGRGLRNKKGEYIPHPVEVGDHVAFNRNRGIDAGDGYKLFRGAELICKIVEYS
jgi:co-chaperonin GroES (HSP10)